MSFMDKVKAQAEQAMVKAQAGVAQGQTKLNEMQANKSHDALLKDLGAAYYAQQRSGGSQEAVTAALAAVDAQLAAAPPPAPMATGGATPAAPATPPAPADPTAPAPSFGLDDL
jgi:hypothetical protein